MPACLVIDGDSSSPPTTRSSSSGRAPRLAQGERLAGRDPGRVGAAEQLGSKRREEHRATSGTATHASPSSQPPAERRAQRDRARLRDGQLQRRKKKRHRLIGTITAVIATLSVATVVALLQRNEAVSAKDSATSRALAARATAALSTEPAKALAQSLEAVKTSRTPQAENALRISVNSRVRFVLPTGKPVTQPGYGQSGAEPVEATFSPDGTLLLTTGVDGVARLWRAASGRPAGAFEVPKQRVQHAVFGPRGTSVLTTSDDSTARLWTASSGKEVARLHVPGARILAATFGARGPIVLTGAPDRAPELRDPRKPGRFVVLEGQAKPPANAILARTGDGC